MILAVGYRVVASRTQFRQWATARLEEYLVKGFTLDDRRLKKAGSGTYFEELLARIRDIRSAEKVFWRKVLDIYATSIDYDPRRRCLSVFPDRPEQDALGCAWTYRSRTHRRSRRRGQTNMGLLSWSGDAVRKTDVVIAKNYLNPEELDALNRIVTAYLGSPSCRH